MRQDLAECMCMGIVSGRYWEPSSRSGFPRTPAVLDLDKRLPKVFTLASPIPRSSRFRKDMRWSREQDHSPLVSKTINPNCPAKLRVRTILEHYRRNCENGLGRNALSFGLQFST